MKAIEELRKDFEEIEDIKKRLESLEYSQQFNEYLSDYISCTNEAFVSGAWWMFQELKK